MKLENGILALITALIAGMGLDLSGISAWLAELANLSLWAFQWAYRLGLLGLAGGLIVGLARLYADYNDRQADKAHNKRLREFELQHQQAQISLLQAKAVSIGRQIQLLKPSQRAIIASHLGDISLIEAAMPPLQLPGEALVDGQAHEPQNPCLIDVMLSLDRILLVGGTGSGKTNTLKHFVTGLVNQGHNLTIIDPHSPSQMVGQDVIGAGLDFEAIAHKFVEIMVEVSNRYNQGDIAQDGNMGADNHYIIIEEFYDINDQLGELAAKFLKVLLVRGRKAGVKFCLVSQNDTANALGLRGDTGLLSGAEKIELKYDIRSGQRKATIGRRKADQVEATVPGLFEDYAKVPASRLIVDPPEYTPTQRALALAYVDDPQSSKNGLYEAAGTTKSGPNSKFIDKLQGV